MLEDLTLRKAIELAITTEQIGASFYSRLEKKFGDQAKLKQIFGQLVQDERSHEVQFRTILETVPEEAIGAQQYELYQYLRATAISSFFGKDAFKDVDKLDSSDDALGMALAFEKSTLQYYQAIQDILGEQKQLEQIIDAERGHVVALMKVIVTDGKFRGLNYKW
jgi:rubrerythrin